MFLGLKKTRIRYRNDCSETSETISTTTGYQCFHLKMKKQLLEEFNLQLAAVGNEITALQNQITNLRQPTCTDLVQMKMLVSKFSLSNLKNAQYLHATQIQVANLSEQL